MENKDIKKYALVSIVMLVIGIVIGIKVSDKGEKFDTTEELRPIIKAFCDIEYDMSEKEVKDILKEVSSDIQYKSFADTERYKDEEFYAVDVEDERLRIDFKGGKVWTKEYIRNSSEVMWADASKVYYKQKEDDINYIKLFENKKIILENADEDTIENFTKLLFN